MSANGHSSSSRLFCVGMERANVLLSHHLIETWLEHEPSEEIRRAWKDYVQAICHTISPVAQQTLKRDVLERARQVAKTAGGFLGFHKISHAQETILLEVEKAFEDRVTKGVSR